MNWVVLPLDAMHTKPHFAPWDTWLTGLVRAHVRDRAVDSAERVEDGAEGVADRDSHAPSISNLTNQIERIKGERTNG